MKNPVTKWLVKVASIAVPKANIYRCFIWLHHDIHVCLTLESRRTVILYLICKRDLTPSVRFHSVGLDACLNLSTSVEVRVQRVSGLSVICKNSHATFFVLRMRVTTEMNPATVRGFVVFGIQCYGPGSSSSLATYRHW